MVPVVGEGFDGDLEGHVIPKTFPHLLISEHVHERVVDVDVESGLPAFPVPRVLVLGDIELGDDEQGQVGGLPGDVDVVLDQAAHTSSEPAHPAIVHPVSGVVEAALAAGDARGDRALGLDPPFCVVLEARVLDAVLQDLALDHLIALAKYGVPVPGVLAHHPFPCVHGPGRHAPGGAIREQNPLHVLREACVALLLQAVSGRSDPQEECEHKKHCRSHFLVLVRCTLCVKLLYVLFLSSFSFFFFDFSPFCIINLLIFKKELN